MKIGIITTTSGVLLTKADMMQTRIETEASVITGWAPACFAALCPIQSSAPVRTSPPTMMNMKAMVQGAEFDSTPAMASVSRIPRDRSVTAPMMAVTSGG